MKNGSRNIIDYIGAKNKLTPQIIELAETYTGPLDDKSFTEIFAGTAAMSRWLLYNRNLKQIITNDFEAYSTAVCLATTRKIKLNEGLYRYLNQLPGYKGFVTTHGSPAGRAGRMFFTEENARKIDGMKFHIKNMLDLKVVTIDEAIKLAGELTIAADKVSNTASVYGAYLKKFKATSLKPISISPQEPNVNSNPVVWNLMLDANDAIVDITGDVLYVDPPYNQRQYGCNYHVLNWIADLWGDEKYVPRGVTGVHKDWQRSSYCNKKKIAGRLNHLIKNARFEYIVFSYSNRGLIPLVMLLEIFEKYTEVLEVKRIEYNNFRADKNRRYDERPTTEYVIILKKSD